MIKTLCLCLGQECADEQVLPERQSSHMFGEGVCIMLFSYFNDLWLI